MLINLRNALMTGKLLPYDAEVEYLESTGTQWIDTGIIPDDTTGYFLRCSANSVGGNKVPCGQRETTGDTRWYVNFSSRLEFSWNAYQPVGTYNADTWYDIGYNWMNSRTGTKDRSTVFNISQQLTTRTRTAYAFANHGPSSAANFFDGKIASLKISQGASLLRDFIPVRKGIVGYLYDRVSGKLFGNAGTGDFVLGPDVVPVEYIESHGTEYIDTGRPIPTDFWFDTTIDITGTSSAYKTLLGARLGSTVNDYQFSFASSGNNFLARYGNSNPQYFSSIPTGMTHIRVESGGKLYINESFEKQLGVSSPSAFNMYIFALNNNGTVSQRAQYIRLRSLKYGGLNEEHDHIPVRVGTDATSWEGAMMDVLTRRIYRNAGTGAFTYGNDLKYPIPSE